MTAPDAIDSAPGEAPGGAPRRTALIVSVVVGVVMVAFVAVLALSDTGPNNSPSALLGQPAPPVAGETLDGAEFDIDELRGRWVLVNFFATWCAPCVVEHPELVAFHEAHSERRDVEVVSVAFQNKVEDIEAFFIENGGEWPVLAEGVNALAVAWGVTKLPESFLVSPQGVVVYRFTGGVTADDLELVLAEARGFPSDAEADEESRAVGSRVSDSAEAAAQAAP